MGNPETEYANGNGDTALLQQKQDEIKDEAEATQSNASNSWVCVYTIMISVSSVMLSTGLGVGIINCQLPHITLFYNKSYEMQYNESMTTHQATLLSSLTVSSMLIGGLFGAMSITTILSLLSRKQSLTFLNFLNTAGVILCCLGGWFLRSPEALIIGRVLMGFFAGCGMNLIPIIVAESATLTSQAFYLSMIGVNLSFGGLLGLLFAFIHGIDWPVLLSISSFPSLIYLMSSPFIPDTPFCFVLAGKRTQAANTLIRLRSNISDTEVETTLNAIEEEHKRSGTRESVGLMELFRSPHYRRLLFVVVMVFMQSQLCGINAVGMYTVEIFMEVVQLELTAALIATAVIFAIQFLIAAFGSVAIHFLGTKKLNVCTSYVMSASLFLFTIALYTYKLVPAMKFMTIVAVGIYINAWAGGVNITLFPMVTAYTTGPTRESAFKFAGIIFWILSWFVSFIGPFLWAENSLHHAAFVPFAVLNFLFGIYVQFCLPETGGKTQDEIQDIIQKRKPAMGGTSATDDLL